MSYAWMLTTGTIGPSTAPADAVAQLKLFQGTQFRMYDDDDELMASGWFLGDWESEDGFGPLDDYGTPSLGCTSIQYLNPATGKWEVL